MEIFEKKSVTMGSSRCSPGLARVWLGEGDLKMCKKCGINATQVKNVFDSN